MLPSPLFVEIRSGAVENLAELLLQRNISAAGDVLVAVGASQGTDIWERISPDLPQADSFTVEGATLTSASELQHALGARSYDALVAIGGGRTLDVAKYAATRSAVPLVAVATNLAHDGICSPVASLEHPRGKGSYGVAMPLAVVVDLDYVRTAPDSLVRAGVGDVVSNLSALADWRLAAAERGERVDGLAAAFARAAGEAVLHHPGSIDEEDFLISLAESLVLSGMAMSVAGSSRPCSGACHEIVHAVDALHPGTSDHGELAGLGACFATFLRGDDVLLDQLTSCLSRHGLATVPAEVGLSEEEFFKVVTAAPAMRPDRYTILEHLQLGEPALRRRTEAFCARRR